MEEKTNISIESTTTKQILFEILFLIIAAAGIAFFCQNTPVMSVIIGINIIARFVLIGKKNDWIFFIIGFIFGGGNDLISMIKDVYRYTPSHELAVPIPIWMLFFWGHIILAFRHLFKLPAFNKQTITEKPWKIDFRLIADITVVIILRFIVYNFVKQEPIPTIGYAAIVALRLLILPPKKHEWLLIALVMIIGPAYESALIAFGLYIYYNPVFLGMPAWLIIYWSFMIPILMKGIFDRIEMSLLNIKKVNGTKIPHNVF